MFGVAFICFGCGSCVYLCFVRWRLQGDGADAAQTSRDLPRGISMAQPGGGREVRQAPRSVRTRGAAAQEAADEGLHVRVEAAHRKLGGGRLRRRACGGAQSAAQRGDGKMRHGTGAGAAAATAAHGEVGGKSGGARWVSGGGGRDASCGPRWGGVRGWGASAKECQEKALFTLAGKPSYSKSYAPSKDMTANVTWNIPLKTLPF